MTRLATIHEQHRPFVFIEFHNISVNDENFEEYKKEYLELLVTCKRNNDKIYLIIDVNQLPALPIPYLVKQTELNKQLFNHHQKYLHCAYIYCKSKIFKKMIEFHLFIEKNAVPVKICRSVEKLNYHIEQNFNVTFDFSLYVSNFNSNTSIECESE